MPGSLFTHDYLAQGVRETQDWRDAQARVPAFREALNAAFGAVAKPAGEVEAQIELRIVQPVLEALGWKGLYTVQAKIDQKGRKNVPDYLFFATPEDHAKADALTNHGDRYRHAIALGDAKAWSISLDKRGGGAGLDEAPTGQLLRYMDAASAASDRRVLWGLLTNGHVWRLYFQDARSRLDDYFEVDLAWALERPGAQGELRDPDTSPADLLALFLLFFEREAFQPGAGGRTRHQVALEEGKRWEARIRDDLSEVVFGKVFPGLIRAIVAADRQSRVDDPAYLSEVREAALTALYRLLFALYAEDRDLLPTRSKRFDDYSLSLLRDDVAVRVADEDALSPRVGPIWSKARNLFRLIDEGDDSLGVPPYNGGLFAQDRSPLLERVELSDAAFAPLLHLLSHVDGKRVNYRDLSVRELGSIYERLLEHEPVADPTAEQGVDVRLSVFARKGSGSYYTPDVLVSLIIERTLTPLAEEAEAAFVAALKALPTRADPETVRAELDDKDPAGRILSFKVVDPAMGSGHFLVSLVDWLAERALLADDAATQAARDAGHDWFSPATREIVALRAAVRKEADDNGWEVSEAQLSDANLIKRSVLKRCVYGVDKNPMAVELAKVALWLHTFTAGAPLSFLDHHLRCGDSLFGERVHDVLQELQTRGSLLIAQAVGTAQASVKAMEHIEGLSDARLEDVKESERSFADVTHATAPLAAFLDLWHAARWLKPAGDDLRAWHGLLDGQFGDPLAIASGAAEPNRPRDLPDDATVDWLDRAEAPDQPDLLGAGASTLDYLRLTRLLARARALVVDQRFMHWQVAFPGVWKNWSSSEPQGGFDAVIGNPPWDQLDFESIKWFEVRAPQIANEPTDAKRKAAIDREVESSSALGWQFVKARDTATMALAASKDRFRLFGGRKSYLHQSFVEQAIAIASKAGRIGLLVPSATVTANGAGPFVSKYAAEGRIEAVIDFENRGAPEGMFFAEIDARTRFCALLISPSGLKTPIGVSFFTNIALDLAEQIFDLNPSTLKIVSPSTGVIPPVTSKAALDILERSFTNAAFFGDAEAGRPWQLTYSQMFNRSTSSNEFKDADALKKLSALPLDGEIYRKGDDRFLPLFEGKMVKLYNHRASSVQRNVANIHRPGQSVASTDLELADPSFASRPDFWLNKKLLDEKTSAQWLIAFKDITAATNSRSMIAALLPARPAAHTLPVLLQDEAVPAEERARDACLVIATLNSFMFDYLVRQKLGGTHITSALLKETPVLPWERLSDELQEVIVRSVLELTFVANDMEPFARALGHSGKIFEWDLARRRLAMARIDAAIMLAYGIEDEDLLETILSAFSSIRTADTRHFGGQFITLELIRWFHRAYKSAVFDEPPNAKLMAQLNEGLTP
ncbi:MAG: Eco57I restriction-modification methylase domain-containing protein [Brevundimonas sp.]